MDVSAAEPAERFALFWISFGIREHGWKRLGLTLPNSWTRTFLWAVGAVIVLLVGSELVVQPLAHHYWPEPEYVSSLIKAPHCYRGGVETAHASPLIQSEIKVERRRAH
jgi:hypothetical protein